MRADGFEFLVEHALLRRISHEVEQGLGECRLVFCGISKTRIHCLAIDKPSWFKCCPSVRWRTAVAAQQRTAKLRRMQAEVRGQPRAVKRREALRVFHCISYLYTLAIRLRREELIDETAVCGTSWTAGAPRRPQVQQLKRHPSTRQYTKLLA